MMVYLDEKGLVFSPDLLIWWMYWSKFFNSIFASLCAKLR